jgi:cobalt/nickel transport system permease protein
VPTLAVLAAVAFLVMMFNIPIPDGTTAHAVGAVLIAILLGPWAAVIAVSVALLFQALLFGDGGVLAYGVNVTNMAILMPFAGYAVYKLVARGSTLTSKRRAVAAGIAGYVGINVCALATAIELGIQPVLFHTADGTPLYSPYHLAQTIPAMMLAHLTVAGFVEAALCAGTVAYLQRANLALLQVNHPGVPLTDADVVPRPRRRLNPWWAAGGVVGVMVALTPLGLLAPGGAFGEAAPDQLDLGALGLSSVPQGLNQWNGFWHSALFSDYTTSADANPVVGYLVSSLVGIAVVGGSVFVVVWVVGRLTRARSIDVSSPVVSYQDQDQVASANTARSRPSR